MPKKTNWFLKVVKIFFIFFIFSYIVSISGYHEARVARNVKLTDEALKKFEKDIEKGEIVDIKDYINNDEINYTNKFTKAANKVTNSALYIISQGISGIWDALKVLFLG